MPLNVLVVTKGHLFERGAFHRMFDDNRRLDATFVDHPAAGAALQPEHAAAYDAVVFYDMQGVRGEAPSPGYVRAIEGLLESGTGLILLNHALVQWPAWELWREISGTTFRLAAEVVDGRLVPGSGYRGSAAEPERNATHRLEPVTTHPVTRGLEGGFEITDELYLRTPLAKSPDIVPLFVSDYDFVQDNFNPPPLASAAEQAEWTHPDGDNVIVWAKRTRNSPVVACEAGDGPPAYDNAGFRHLLDNALQWVCSDEARAWARGG